MVTRCHPLQRVERHPCAERRLQAAGLVRRGGRRINSALGGGVTLHGFKPMASGYNSWAHPLSAPATRRPTAEGDEVKESAEQGLSLTPESPQNSGRFNGQSRSVRSKT